MPYTELVIEVNHGTSEREREGLSTHITATLTDEWGYSTKLDTELFTRIRTRENALDNPAWMILNSMTKDPPFRLVSHYKIEKPHQTVYSFALE